MGKADAVAIFFACGYNHITHDFINNFFWHPITIVFDGSQSRRGKMPETANPEFEVLYSHAGQTADDVIERVVARMQPFGEVLVVTDDYVERDTVAYHGGMTVSCFNFIEDVESALAEQERDIARRNRAERRRFKNTQ